MNRTGRILCSALLGAALVMGALGLTSQAKAEEVKVGIFSVNYNSPTIFRMICPSSKHLGRLSLFCSGGFGSSWFDVKPPGVDGSSGGSVWSVF